MLASRCDAEFFHPEHAIPILLELARDWCISNIQTICVYVYVDLSMHDKGSR